MHGDFGFRIHVLADMQRWLYGERYVLVHGWNAYTSSVPG